MRDREPPPHGVAAYVTHVVETCRFLEEQDDLSPRNPELNRRLSAFVADTLVPRTEVQKAMILSHPDVRATAPRLRNLLGQAEYEMEFFCAEAMIGNDPSVDEGYGRFSKFLYMQNYAALIDLELQAMGWPMRQPPLRRHNQTVAFIGAGPLPISAILLHLKTGLPVTCIDSDPKAVLAGRNLLHHLARTEPGCENLAKKVSYIHAEGAAHDYITHPIVFVASLVDSKDPVLLRIVGSSDTARTVVIRSAEGLNALLYKPHACVGGMEDYNVYFSRKTRDCPKAVNTSLVYKIPPGKLRTRNKITWQPDENPNQLQLLKPRLRRTRPYDHNI